ncbi:MAG TPA: HEAT repeat domain-containing protein [Gemmata sp.]|nr:HEAT repeat domain-containing protein [Gemmata sp.]
MFGLDLTRSEWAALVAIVYLFLRVFCAVVRVIWWYVTDALRLPTPRPALALFTAVAVAVMCVATLSVATGWEMGGFRTIAFIVSAIAGFVLGMMFDMVVSIRLWTISDWLMSLRVPQSRERLLHGDAEVRLGASKRLGTLGSYARAAKPELVATTRGDDSAEVRSAAALALLHSITDPPDEDADLATELRPLLADSDPRVRTVGAAVQVTFHSTPVAELLPFLREGLTTDDPAVPGIAADALGRIGGEAAPAVPDLLAAALDEDNPNALAPEALGKIGDAAVPALIEILDRGQQHSALSAADVLGRMGTEARAALPALRKAATRKDPVGNTAQRAIKQLGGDIA